MKNSKWILPLLGVLILVGAFFLAKRNPAPPKSIPEIRQETTKEEKPVLPEEKVPKTKRKKPDPPPAEEDAPPQYNSIIDRLLTAIRTWDKEQIRKVLDDLLALITPEPIPDHQNSAILYKKAFERLSELTEEEKAAREAFKNGEPVTEAEKEILRAYLEKNRDSLELIAEGSQRPGCNFNVQWKDGFGTELPHISEIIQLQSLALLDANLGEGKTSARSAEIVALLGDSLQSDPLILSQLVQSACISKSHALLQENWNPAGYTAFLETGLGNRDFGKGLQLAMLGELHASTRVFIENINETEGGPNPADNPNWANDLETLTRLYQDIYNLVPRPYHEIREEISQIETRIKTAPHYAEVTQKVFPDVGSILQRMTASEAITATQRIALALSEHRNAQGSYPTSLEQIKSIPPGLMQDPFTGQPYKYRREGNGFVLYSVGSDGLDNGGNSKEKDLLFRVEN